MADSSFHARDQPVSHHSIHPVLVQPVLHAYVLLRWYAALDKIVDAPIEIALFRTSTTLVGNLELFTLQRLDSK